MKRSTQPRRQQVESSVKVHLLLNFHESYLKYLVSVKVQKMKNGVFGIFRVQLHSNGRQVCSLICSERRENWRPKAAPEAQSRAKQPRAASRARYYSASPAPASPYAATHSQLAPRTHNITPTTLLSLSFSLPPQLPSPSFFVLRPSRFTRSVS